MAGSAWNEVGGEWVVVVVGLVDANATGGEVVVVVEAGERVAVVLVARGRVVVVVGGVMVVVVEVVGGTVVVVGGCVVVVGGAVLAVGGSVVVVGSEVVVGAVAEVTTVGLVSSVVVEVVVGSSQSSGMISQVSDGAERAGNARTACNDKISTKRLTAPAA